MAKQTQKYKAAFPIASKLKFVGNWDDQNEVYQFLNERHYVWNSKNKQWEDYQAEPSNPPTNLLMIRVWTGDREESLQIARFLRYILERAGLEYLKQSEPYPCRPPQQNDYRVYLEMKKKEGETFASLFDEESIASELPRFFDIILNSPKRKK